MMAIFTPLLGRHFTAGPHPCPFALRPFRAQWQCVSLLGSIFGPESEQATNYPWAIHLMVCTYDFGLDNAAEG